MIGIDISFAQGNPDFDALTGEVGWVSARATYGADGRDDDGPIFRRSHDECKRLQIPFGCYHFVRFADDPIAQIRHFLEQIDGRYGQVRPMLDVEEASCLGMDSASQALSDLSKMSAILETRVARPLIYTNYDSWVNLLGNSSGFCGHLLWLAGPATTLPFGGWNKYAVWQYGTGKVPGISGQVDLDLLEGGDLGLIRYP